MLKFTSIGDCVVDNYPDLNQSFLGGTAFNVALRSRQAHAQTSLISCVGSDSWGKKYQKTLKDLKINSDYLQVIDSKTSHINITLDSHNRPTYSKWQLEALKSLQLTFAHEHFLKTQTAVRCTVFKPIQNLINQFCKFNLPNTFKIADFGDDSIYSPTVNLIPRYLSSLNLITKSLSANDTNSITFLKNLKLTKSQMILITLGSQGSQVFTSKENYHCPALKTKTTDTTGAGDAYLASFIINYLKTKNIPQAMKLATQAAAEKITRLGASS